MSETRQQVAPKIHRFTDALANWYGGGLVLVDCGWPRSGRRLVAGLPELGRAVEDVQAFGGPVADALARAREA